MKRIMTAAMAAVCATAGAVWATNGDNLIGVGPVSRGMGGVGVAAPQDSVSAIFINPAGMNNCPCGAKSEAVFGSTVFDPAVDTKIRTPMGTYEGSSQHDFFIIPAMGVTMPINESWRFGIGAYGISGLGVDYRNKGWDLDGNPANGFEADLYSRLEVMKFAPMVSYKVNEKLSLGIAAQAAYNNLDLGQGGTHDYAYGTQIGLVYALSQWQFGFSYTTPQKATFDRVYNFDSFMGSTSMDSLALESPASYVAGVAYQPTKRLVLEVDAKYYDWANAEGYKDFDWDSQTVIAGGVQYIATDKLTVRAGFNYGQNPVNEHNGFDPMGATEIQGKQVPTLGYELLRTVGFPAITETHLTLGLGIKLTETCTLNLDYKHALEKTITETSAGDAFKLESSLAENAYGFSLSWQFE